MKSWCRVNIRKNKTLRNLAEESGNTHSLKLLNKYESTSEAACAAFALDCGMVRDIIKSGEAHTNSFSVQV